MHFKKPRVKQSKIIFKIGDEELDYTDTYKYIGLGLSAHMNFVSGMERLTESASRALGMIISKYKATTYM